MKKERNLLIILGVLTLLFVIMFFFVSTFKNNWFAMAFLFLAIYMFCKAYFFRSDSSIFFGSIFFQNFFLFFDEIYKGLTTFQLGTVFALIISISFLVCHLIFNSKFTLILFLTNFLLTFPIFLFAFNCINLILMVSFLCGVLILFVSIILLGKNEKI